MKKVSIDGGDFDIFVSEPGDSISIEDFTDSKDGITQDQFHSILDKASQPIEKPKSDSENSET